MLMSLANPSRTRTRTRTLITGFAIIGALGLAGTVPLPLPLPLAMPSKSPLQMAAPVAVAAAVLPVDFVENAGQWADDVLFAVPAGSASAVLKSTVIEVPGGVALTFEGALAGVTAEGETASTGVYNFILGNDPAEWRGGVHAYASVLYRGMYDGIDVRVRQATGEVQYDVLVEPTARLSDVRISVPYGTSLSLGEDGSLVAISSTGTLRQDPPVSWNLAADGTRLPVESRFRIIDERHYGFEASGNDPSLPLVVDPGIEWSTFIGGSSAEFLGGMVAAPGASGDVIIGGSTRSPEFPPSGQARAAGTPFIARLAGNGGSLVYATFFGGSMVNTVDDVAVDASGNVLAVGETNSKDFPITAGAFDSTPPGTPSSPLDFGDYDGYAIRFNSSGGGPLMATYISGDPVTGQEVPTVAGYTPSGNPVVGGRQNATNFPTTVGAYDRTHTAGGTDVFVNVYNPTGTQLLYGTFLGGDGLDQVFDMAVGSDGIINLTGQTIIPATGARYPTTAGAFDSTVSGANDFEATFTRLAPNGGGTADLRYSTYLGGNQYTEAGNGIAIHPSDPTQVTLSGFTRSGDFPTTPGALLRTHFAPIEASMGWVARFTTPTAGGGSIVWSTLYGAPGQQSANDVAVNTAGEAIIVGGTAAADPPTTERAFDRVPAGGSGNGDRADGYVAKLAANGSSLVFSSLIGARWGETADEVVLAGTNAAVVSGITNSADFPTTVGAFDRIYAADGKVSGNDTPGGLANDIFVSRVSLDPNATTDVTGPAAPTIAWPAENATFTQNTSTGIRVAFDWNDVTDPSGIQAYHVQVSPNPEFRNDFQAQQNYWYEAWSPTSFDSTSYCCSSTFNFTYRMRVRVLDGAGNLGPWSAVRTFRVVGGTTPGSTGTGLRSLTVSPEVAAAPTNITGTVTLHAAAPSGGAVVALASQHPSRLQVPASVTVPAGATSATFAATTTDGLGPVYPVIVGSYGGSSHAGWVQLLQREPTLVLGSLTTSAVNVAGGGTLTGTVAFSGIGFVPGPGGAVVNLATTNPAVAQVPATVTIPEGQSSATFPITTSVVGGTTSVTILASRSSLQTRTIEVLAAGGLSSVSASPNPAIGSNGSTGTVTLSSAAPAGGTVVTLSSSDTRWVRVPASVTVPAGSTSATFAISTTADPTQGVFASITASAGGVDRFTSLNVNPGGSPPSTLSTPTLVAPASGTRFNRGATITFDWSDVSGATGYVIEIDDSSSFTVPLTLSRATTASNAPVNTLPSGRFYWRVRATGANGAVSANSASRRVEVR